MKYSSLQLAAAGCLALVPSLGWGCATCGCTLSTDAATGYSALPGWRVNFEYDYINQDQLRSGTHTVSGVPNGNELEHQTINRYLTLGAIYSPNADWNVQVRVPYVSRNHTTYGTFDSTQPLPQLSGSHSSSFGDAKFIGAYQGFLPTHNLGAQLGVKLPSGPFGTSVKFNNGPNAGSPLDASLQPGTGSTDLIVGGYYYQGISRTLDIFLNGSFQAAVTNKQDQPGNDFRPGNQSIVSFGFRYKAIARIVPEVQVNLLRKAPDQGALADRPDTAGTVAYIGPGLIATVLDQLQLYGFVQVPVYSQLNGYQLFPHWTGSVGLTYSF